MEEVQIIELKILPLGRRLFVRNIKKTKKSYDSTPTLA